jgi:hypothetical protein
MGGSKADLLELKVAVVTSGLGSEVQRIPQQMHQLRPLTVPDHNRVHQSCFLAWCEVGACRARCCALSMAPWHWHQGPSELAIELDTMSFSFTADEEAALIDDDVELCG